MDEQAANMPIVNGFDFSLVNEYFVGLERQGPGSPDVTIKALSLINENVVPSLYEPITKALILEMYDTI